MCVDVHRSQKVSDPLELKLQVVLSQYAGAGNHAQFSARAVHSALEPICSMKWEGWEQEKNCRKKNVESGLQMSAVDWSFYRILISQHSCVHHAQVL